MAWSKSNSADKSARAWTLAEQQHGVVTRRDLLGLGFSPTAIDHRLASGRLHALGRGVYAVGWPHLSQQGRWMAAVLACGPGAALSHRSAGALWGFASEGDAVDISVRRRCRCRRDGIRARSRASLPDTDILEQDRIPVTAPTRTLVDLAAELEARALERAVNEADKRGLVKAMTLRDRLSSFRGERGVAKLRLLLDRDTFALSDSDLEVRFRPIAEAAGLPLPLTKAWVNGFQVDFFWPDLGLVVETDGLRYHRTPAVQARDRVRDQTHAAAGLTTLRFTHRQVRYEAAYVRRVLRATAANLSRS